jgi:hypothetical protein
LADSADGVILAADGSVCERAAWVREAPTGPGTLKAGGIPLLLRATIVWALLAILAVLNGIARSAWLLQRLGEERAHVVSTVVLCVVVFVVAFVFIGWIRPRNIIAASVVGLVWAALTLAFEFLAGHYVFGHTWERLLADYNLMHGRFWVLVPIVTYLAPRWAYRLRGL